jgi:subtilisin family serine protease
MIQRPLCTLLRGLAFGLAVLALTLAAPSDAAAKDKSVKKEKSVKEKSVKEKSKKTIDLQPGSRGQVRRIYAQRGGNRAGSNPTTVPVVDDDFLLMAPRTLRQLGADAAHVVTRGAGVIVAVLDGGFVLDHPDIAGHVSPWGYDAIDEDFDPYDAGNHRDDDLDGAVDGGVGHGTFVIGMILSAAPDAIVVPIRIRDDEGWGTNEELERGLSWALAIGADVVNVSGEATHGRSKPVDKLIRELRERGCVVVTSAGNDGEATVSEVGEDKDALRVGAVDANDRLADFSNWSKDRGVRILYAPGVDLYGPLGVIFPESRGYWSGTSFSAALVSGAAALVHARYPWLGALEVMDRLVATADPAWDEVGARLPVGRVDLLTAVSR